jgi:hypothetical protein
MQTSLCSGKKMFVKLHAGTELFKNKVPNTPLTPTQQLHAGEPRWMAVCIVQKTLKGSVLW